MLFRSIPFGLPSAKTDTRARATLQPFSPMRTLVVDDQETSLSIMRGLLETLQFDVETSTSGEQALQKLQASFSTGKPFELLLLDWKMPGMDGLQIAIAADKLVQGTAHAHLPTIIMVTAFCLDQLKNQAGDGALGLIDAILPKPVTSSSLFDALLTLQTGGARPVPHEGTALDKARRLLQGIRGAHVLLVEDNELNRQVIGEFLTRGGLQVSTANDGLEALERLQSMS